MAVNTALRPRRLHADRPKRRRKDVFGFTHMSPYWFIYEPSCAKPPHGAKNSSARRREREWRYGGGSHWTQPIAKSVTACFAPVELTRGPWHPDHQHAGPPSALICRAIERAAANDGLTHLGRLTVNLMRPAPIGECRVEVVTDYVGRNAGHYSGSLDRAGQGGRALHGAHAARGAMPVPEGAPGHPPPAAPKPPDECPVVKMNFAGELVRLRQSGRKSARGTGVSSTDPAPLGFA